MNNLFYIKPRGSQTQQSIINVVNYVTDIICKNIVLPNDEKLKVAVEQISKDNDTILDLQFQNDLLQDQVEEDNDALLDLDYRLNQLEDNMEV